MNYQAIYAAFIDDRRTKEAALKDSGAYSERHHIIPRAHAGDDSAENLIRLTPEDHFFAHLLVAKIYGGKMWLAVVLMTASHSKCYGESRKLHGYAARAAQRNKAPDQKTKEKMLFTQQRKAPRFDFVHLETSEVFSGTTLEFRIHAGISQASTSKIATERSRTAQGWALLKNIGIPVGKRDLTCRIFTHKDGNRFEGTAYDFRHLYGINAALVSELINGRRVRKTSKGWSYGGEK